MYMKEWQGDPYGFWDWRRIAVIMSHWPGMPPSISDSRASTFLLLAIIILVPICTIAIVAKALYRAECPTKEKTIAAILLVSVMIPWTLAYPLPLLTTSVPQPADVDFATHMEVEYKVNEIRCLNADDRACQATLHARRAWDVHEGSVITFFRRDIIQGEYRQYVGSIEIEDGVYAWIDTRGPTTVDDEAHA